MGQHEPKHFPLEIGTEDGMPRVIDGTAPALIFQLSTSLLQSAFAWHILSTMSPTVSFFRSLCSSAIILTVCAPTLIAHAKVTADLRKDCPAYQTVPLPAEADRIPPPKSFPDCASYRSYRGIGRPRNYSEARACAWQERAARDAGLERKDFYPWFAEGSLILADIYINGDGVQRNIPLAIRFACESDEGIAQLALPEIPKLTGSSSPRAPFEFCDYAATTITMNFCSLYRTEVDDDRKSRYYRSIEISMKSEEKTAFEKLLAASDKYINDHGLEVDQGGTIRGIRTSGSQNILKDLFRTELSRFENKKWPALSENQVKTADVSLRHELLDKIQELSKQTQEQIRDGAVSADDLKKVQKSWENYRDAWFAFAQLRYPSAAQQIRAQIILDRYRFVKTIHSYRD